jgi:hypothetical protein
MRRRKVLIIAILVVILIGLLSMIAGALFITSGPDLTQEDKSILVLCSDKYEQSNGGVDMAFMIELENGTLSNFTPIYPGELSHPTQPAPGGLGGNMMMHDCLWDGLDQGMQYASEIVESRLGMHSDSVIVLYDEGVDNILDTVRPLKVDGEETNLSATEIIRSNDGYFGYGSSAGVTGTMSRADAVMVLVKAIANAAKDPDKKATMVKAAINEYNKGNIVMHPEGSFAKLLASKGFESMFG